MSYRLAILQTNQKDESQVSRHMLSQIGNWNESVGLPHPEHSISHSDGLCAVVYAEGANGVGIDIEKKRSVDPRVTNFFLSLNELKQLGDEKLSNDQIQAFWTIKEAVFKSDINNHDRVYRDYEILNFPSDKLSGFAKCLKSNSVFSFKCTELEGSYLSIAHLVSQEKNNECI